MARTRTCFPFLRNYWWSSTNIPWLDTGIESGIGCLQICPGWIQVSNLELVVYRYALAGYWYQISKLFMQICPGWIQVSNMEFVVYRYALAGYRYRISKLFMQICPGWIQVSNLQSIAHRYALARYMYRIWNCDS